MACAVLPRSNFARPEAKEVPPAEGSSNLRSYQLFGNQIFLSEGDAMLGPNTGWRTWAGGWLLAKHLEAYLPQRNGEAPRILDLSCGTGLAGVALAKAGYEVVLCDLVENVQTIRDNLTRNRSSKHPCVEKAQVVGYSWGRPLPEELQQVFDLILCGDLLFHVWSGKLQTEFMQTLQDICRRSCHHFRWPSA